MKVRSTCGAVSLVALLLFVGQAAGPLVSPASAAPPAASVIPMQSFGTTYGDLSAMWWQWLLSIPAAANPNLDQSGKACGQGQVGDVWFLAGTFGGTVTRTCTDDGVIDNAIPAGKAIFFPLINSVAFKLKDSETVLDLRRMNAQFIDTVSVSALQCEIDGVAVDNLSSFRVQSPSFTTQVRSGGLIAAKTYEPMVSDGYWLLLSPLPAGQHTVHYHAETAGGFVADVTYNLTVK